MHRATTTFPHFADASKGSRVAGVRRTVGVAVEASEVGGDMAGKVTAALDAIIRRVDGLGSGLN
jgi:hypothetical protein